MEENAQPEKDPHSMLAMLLGISTNLKEEQPAKEFSLIEVMLSGILTNSIKELDEYTLKGLINERANIHIMQKAEKLHA